MTQPKPKWLRISGLLALGILLGVIGINVTAGERRIIHPVVAAYSVSDPSFPRALSHLLAAPWVAGNRIESLENGDEVFPAMLAAIRAARHTITLESFIFWSGNVGKQFTDALSERARSGVRVHLLVDWLGSKKMDPAHAQQMEQAGVQITRYHPPRWYQIARLNHRDHRKILVVDGKVGFTGGLGIADPWLGNADSKEHWRDSHFQIVGPAAQDIESVFMDNWIKTRGDVLTGAEYFPAVESSGSVPLQVFKSSRDAGGESMRLMYLLAIAAARHTIHIANSYFVPDQLAIDALVAARRRGVQVQIIVPGKGVSDANVTGAASRSRWGPLLDAGIEIYEFQPTMYHVKEVVVDSLWTSVGSTNFDLRSFRLNDEMNVNVYDRTFAVEQIGILERDRARSRRMTLEDWRQRPVTEKLVELFAGLFRAQL